MSPLTAIAARLGAWWYVIPSLAVVLLGLATCNMIDVVDPDRFEVTASIVHPSGTRAAVIVRHTHADSGAKVACIWIVAGPAPTPGPVKRLAQSCVLVSTVADMPLDVRWQPNGRLRVTLPPGVGHSTSDVVDQRCYFEHNKLGAHVCYWPQNVDIAPGG